MPPGMPPEMGGAPAAVEPEPPGPGAAVVDDLKAMKDEARIRAELATEVMKDQLEHTGYREIGRRALNQAVKIGIGVCKGPVMGFRPKKTWRKEEGAKRSYKLEYEEQELPAYEWVDAFNFFPDMDATRVEEADFIFQLHRLSARQLRELAARPDFDSDAIRDLLKQGPMYEAFVDYVNDLRDVETPIVKANENRWFVWEYHGPVQHTDLEKLCEAHERGDIMEVYGGAGEEGGDPLELFNGIAWVCQGRIMKFGPSTLDTGEHLFSTVRIDGDESTMFGDSVPAMIRDPQRAVNAAWRIMMQNGALAGLPMFVVDRALKAVDGKTEIKAGKIWEREHAQEAAGIQAVEVAGNSSELVRIIEMAMMFAEQESNLPLIAQGEQSTGETKTAHGLNLLANAVNVIFRNTARSFDWDFTEPNIRRLYDWNMQFSDNEEIKGDLEIKARGSSALLVRDIQAQNLMMIMNLAATNPLLSQLLKIDAVARRLFQALQLSKDEMVMSDTEWKELQTQLQQQGDPAAEQHVRARADEAPEPDDDCGGSAATPR